MQLSSDPASRLIDAERRGLRLAILCRTLAVGAAFVWLLGASLSVGYTPNPWGLAALSIFTLFGLAHLTVIGTRYDRWWLKYLIYAADTLGVCALFVFMPVSRGAEVPQIIAFRAYGIYYLFPLIGLACLTLSWRLVAWTGLIAVAGWWSAFGVVVKSMERRLSWGDMPQAASAEAYDAIFLSADFIGTGNRVEETGFLLVTALILALAVYRARQVFFAQIAAEAEREQERAARERVASTLGRYVPEAIAARLVEDEAGLAPQVRQGAALMLDIAGFTAFAATRDPSDVIAELNRFLARCADVVSEQDGVVISYTGDGLLATFNTPIETSEPEQAALTAARGLMALSDDDADTGQTFRIRIGITSGPIASGSVGSAKRQAFTVYGDTINRASRLEALAKELGEVVLIDEGVAAKAPDRDALKHLGKHALRGLDEPADVWTLAA